MGEYMLNSVIVTALALALLLVVALPAAYCLSRCHFKGRKVLNTLFMAGLDVYKRQALHPMQGSFFLPCSWMPRPWSDTLWRTLRTCLLYTSPKSNSELEVYIITCKHDDAFKQLE